MTGHEHTIRRDLVTPWLEGHGLDVYWEPGTQGRDSFTFDGRGRPDMLVVSEDEALVVELKYGGQARVMADAVFQAYEYLEQLADGADVETDNGGVDVTGVAVANQHSPSGTLYDEEPTNEHFGPSRPNANMPGSEGPLTEEYVRFQWALYRNMRDEHNLGFGALLSDTLNNGGNWPAVLWYRDNYRTKQEFKILR
jgi:hypothetical protein